MGVFYVCGFSSSESPSDGVSGISGFSGFVGESESSGLFGLFGLLSSGVVLSGVSGFVFESSGLLFSFELALLLLLFGVSTTVVDSFV